MAKKKWIFVCPFSGAKNRAAPLPQPPRYFDLMYGGGVECGWATAGYVNSLILN